MAFTPFRPLRIALRAINFTWLQNTYKNKKSHGRFSWMAIFIITPHNKMWGYLGDFSTCMAFTPFRPLRIALRAGTLVGFQNTWKNKKSHGRFFWMAIFIAE